MSFRTFTGVVLCGVALVLGSSAHAVTIDRVTVGDPGNAADATGYGAVAQSYRISMFEVTNAQYAEFLNAVGATDTNALYSTSMGSGYGGITRSGSSGSYSYSAIAGREDMPVNYVSFWDAARFANWLHNGQPTGAQDSTTTEGGAYTLTPTAITNNTVTRNPGATVSLPSEDEWYKAAYYDSGTTSYFAYPAGFDTQTTCAVPSATLNTANCSHGSPYDVTDVGSYTGSASPNGTFDQGGNVWEWNEDIGGVSRVLRGGDFGNHSETLGASYRNFGVSTVEFYGFGFRVASVPEPGTGFLQMTAMLVLAGLRRRRA